MLDQGVGFGIGEHPAHLLLQDRGQMQLVLAGNFDEFVVRDAAPDQERQAGGQFQVGNAIGLAGRYVRRLPLCANQEWRAGQDAA